MCTEAGDGQRMPKGIEALPNKQDATRETVGSQVCPQRLEGVHPVRTERVLVRLPPSAPSQQPVEHGAHGAVDLLARVVLRVL